MRFFFSGIACTKPANRATRVRPRFSEKSWWPLEAPGQEETHNGSLHNTGRAQATAETDLRLLICVHRENATSFIRLNAHILIIIMMMKHLLELP